MVMAGGQGTRLWPASRKRNPKQFLKLFGRKTLIENTIDRISKAIPQKRIFIITDASQTVRVRRIFPKIPARQIVGEPCARNTAATIGLGALLIQKEVPAAVFAVFPADHVIMNIFEFKKCVSRAASWARVKGRHVLFGVQPTYPATAYGYVERTTRPLSRGIYSVKRFIEKPNLRTASHFVRNNRYYWQAGIFVWRADTILESLRKYLPKHDQILRHIVSRWKRNGTRFALPNLFARLPKISIDYGIMEKLKAISMVPATFDWNDIGSWNALRSVWRGDSAGNAAFGPIAALDAKRNLSYSPRLVSFVGVHDLIVVDTDDALLVASQDQAEKVKDLVAHLKKRKLHRYL